MIEDLKEILSITAKAKDLARQKDFSGLAALLERREELMAHAGGSGCGELSETQKLLIQELLLCIRELDQEITAFIKDEMAEKLREITEIATQSKVLSAYGKSLVKLRKFDRVK
ncbi:MAG TPA: flagellar protein FliT [Firmicutes bacterium]|nr:flagellar protein FliT [Candidatus Fermentithermobacillaceae bacterium]